MSKPKEQTVALWHDGIERGLAELAARAGEGSEKLTEAANYVLLGGGKRLRALVTLAVSKDLSKGRVGEGASMRPAVSIEALHAASLVHDDLPSLDNDDFRRGKPSCHKAFGEATAVLLGDLLIGAAIASLVAPEVSLAQQARLSGVLAETWRALCVGQQLDIESPRDETQRSRMIELKTGALFGAAAACGAICGGVTDDVVEGLNDWGVRLGVLFQKLDDIDDGERAESELESVRAQSEQLLGELTAIAKRELSLTAFVAARALKLSE
jgi:geranylgeranyl pyrophosphate synthase